MRKRTEKISPLLILGFVFTFFLLNLKQPGLTSKSITTVNPKSQTTTSPLPKFKKVTPRPYISPTPLPLLSATRDTTIQISATKVNVTIPKGSKYKTDFSWELTIYPTENLEIGMCWGCQPIGTFAVCGESYGMTGEGNCTKSEIKIGKWTFHQYNYTDSKRFAFMAGNGTDNRGTGLDFVSIQTKNNSVPTDQEKQIINKILSSLTKNW